VPLSSFCRDPCLDHVAPLVVFSADFFSSFWAQSFFLARRCFPLQPPRLIRCFAFLPLARSGKVSQLFFSNHFSTLFLCPFRDLPVSSIFSQHYYETFSLWPSFSRSLFLPLPLVYDECATCSLSRFTDRSFPPLLLIKWLLTVFPFFFCGAPPADIFTPLVSYSWLPHQTVQRSSRSLPPLIEEIGSLWVLEVRPSRFCLPHTSSPPTFISVFKVKVHAPFFDFPFLYHCFLFRGFDFCGPLLDSLYSFRRPPFRKYMALPMQIRLTDSLSRLALPSFSVPKKERCFFFVENIPGPLSSFLTEFLTSFLPPFLYKPFLIFLFPPL